MFLRSRADWLARCVMKAIDPWARPSYSQEGEDILLERLLGEGNHGFYVDVGAHHPKRFSNTHYFYMRGWHGLNIEPNPAVSDLFRTMRKRDINLQLGISDHPGELLYYEFNDPALNTFDEQLMQERERTTSYRVVATRKVHIELLASVLEKHLPAGRYIDFLTIDVEGLDLNVLRSNDWNRFRPRCVVSEALNGDLAPASLERNELVSYMRDQEYRLVAKTCNSWFFLDMRAMSSTEAK